MGPTDKCEKRAFFFFFFFILFASSQLSVGSLIILSFCIFWLLFKMFRKKMFICLTVSFYKIIMKCHLCQKEKKKRKMNKFLCIFIIVLPLVRKVFSTIWLKLFSYSFNANIKLFWSLSEKKIITKSLLNLNFETHFLLFNVITDANLHEETKRRPKSTRCCYPTSYNNIFSLTPFWLQQEYEWVIYFLNQFE